MAKPAATVRQRRVRCRQYDCVHGVTQSTCKCATTDKEIIIISCRLDCPGRVKPKGRKRGK